MQICTIMRLGEATTCTQQKKTHNPSLTSVIGRKRDCKSVKFLAISKGEIKMAVYK